MSLDEDLPHLPRHNLGDHEAFTVRYRGWAGLKNGELLKAAEDRVPSGSRMRQLQSEEGA
jgi:hypothetical protein